MQRLGLTWVLVGGQPRRVSEFAPLPPARRPAATCPACGRRLILKLGAVRRHHAAHAPDAVCVATQPETALHLDVKLALAAQLLASAGVDAELWLRLRCAAGRDEGCEATRDLSWLRGWDEVMIEGRVGSAEGHRRPDILLRRRGADVAAIEVLVSHRVSGEKADVLARLRVPWVEVQACERLIEEGVAVEGGALLPAERIGPEVAPEGWRCDTHARRETWLRAARVVDTYRERGIRERRIYRVDEARIERMPRALTLRRDGREIASAPYDGSPQSRRVAWAQLQGAFEADLDLLAREAGSFHDSPMRWAAAEAAENIVEEGLFDVRPGDPLPLASRYPRRWYFARETGQWFVPPDMRDVRWDRDSPDAFAAHPAWARSRAVVAERPVPERSWQGVVFARRPVASSFAPAAGITHLGPIAIVALEAPAAGATGSRALAVLSSVAADRDVRRVDAMLRDDGVEHLWLSHPIDWSAARADLPWAAAAGDSRGRPIVLIDGLGIYRADAFARAFARGERRLAPEAIRQRMAARVQALRR